MSWLDALDLRVSVGTTGWLSATDPARWEPSDAGDYRWDRARWGDLPAGPIGEPDTEDGWVWHQVECRELSTVAWSVGHTPWAWNASPRTASVTIRDPEGRWHPTGRRGAAIGVRPDCPVRIDVVPRAGHDWPGGTIAHGARRVPLWRGFIRNVALTHTPTGVRATTWECVDTVARIGSANPTEVTDPAADTLADRLRQVWATAAAQRVLPAWLIDAAAPLVADLGDPAVSYPSGSYGGATWAELAKAANSAAYRLTSWPGVWAPVAVPARRPTLARLPDWTGPATDPGIPPVVTGDPSYWAPSGRPTGKWEPSTGPRRTRWGRLDFLPTYATGVPWISNRPDLAPGGLTLCPDTLQLSNQFDDVANVVSLAAAGGTEQTVRDNRSVLWWGPHTWGRNDLTCGLGDVADVAARTVEFLAEAVWNLEPIRGVVDSPHDLAKWVEQRPGGVIGPTPAMARSHCVPILWDDPSGFQWRAPAALANLGHTVTPTSWRVTAHYELGVVDLWSGTEWVPQQAAAAAPAGV